MSKETKVLYLKQPIVVKDLDNDGKPNKFSIVMCKPITAENHKAVIPLTDFGVVAHVEYHNHIDVPEGQEQSAKDFLQGHPEFVALNGL